MPLRAVAFGFGFGFGFGLNDGSIPVVQQASWIVDERKAAW